MSGSSQPLAPLACHGATFNDVMEYATPVLGVEVLFILFVLLKAQYNAKHGHMDKRGILVFPVYVYILIAGSVLLTMRGVILLFSKYTTVVGLLQFCVLDPFVAALREGISLFLAQRNAGRRAINRALALSIVWGLVIAFVPLGGLLWASSRPATDSEIDAPLGVPLGVWLATDILKCLFHVTISIWWLRPQHQRARQTRSYLYSVYTAVLFLGFVIADFVGSYIDITPDGEVLSTCMQTIIQVLYFATWPIAAYWALIRDANYWRQLGKRTHSSDDDGIVPRGAGGRGRAASESINNESLTESFKKRRLQKHALEEASKPLLSRDSLAREMLEEGIFEVATASSRPLSPGSEELSQPGSARCLATTSTLLASADSENWDDSVFSDFGSIKPQNLRAFIRARRTGFVLDFSEIQMGKRLGDGATATVYEGKVHGNVVAVKLFKCEQLTANVVAMYKREVMLYAQLRHENIVLLFAVCVIVPQLALVMEHCANGSLFHYIRSRRAAAVSRMRRPPAREQLRTTIISDYLRQDEKYSLAHGIASGLAHLHSQQPAVLHLDLKSLNVLIDRQLVPKLCDFGEAQVLDDGTRIYGKQARGTANWMAPEVMTSAEYSTRADVYSLGMVMWEIMAGLQPFAFYKLPYDIMRAVAIHHERPFMPEQTPAPFRRIMELCQLADPHARPTASQARDVLAHLKRKDEAAAARLLDQLDASKMRAVASPTLSRTSEHIDL